MTKSAGGGLTGAADAGGKPRSSRLHWYHAYFLLAAFDLATISFSLYLNHRILDIYTRSVEVNQVWAERSRHYREIEQLAALVNAPGNDVFATQEPREESARVEAAMRDFQESLDMANRYVQADTSPEDADDLSAGLAKIQVSMTQMVDASRRIFPAIERGETAVAGQHMAEMDRYYANLRTLLDDLQRRVHEVQEGNFDSQMAAARDLGRYEYVVMGFIVFIVIAVTVYGYNLGQKMEALRRERETFVFELQRAEAATRETNDKLEATVQERTEGLRAALERQSELARSNAEAYALVRETQEQLVRKERLAAVGEVAALVAHGIRNPLASISAAAETGRNEVSANDPLAETLDDIVAETRRLETRIRAVLDFSHPFEPTVTESDLNEFLRMFREQLRRRVPETVTLRLVLDDTLVPVPFDSGQLTEALEAVIVNALEAMGEEGTLTLSSGLEGGSSQRFAVICVSDTGPGIDESRLPLVFDLFYTSKPSGTGIGLAMAKKMIEAQGGRIDIDRGTPQGSTGTTFRIRLPLPAPTP